MVAVYGGWPTCDEVCVVCGEGGCLVHRDGKVEEEGRKVIGGEDEEGRKTRDKLRRMNAPRDT